MNVRTARWTAWFLVFAYVILAAIGLSLQGLTRAPFGAAALPIAVILVSLVGGWIVTGALIISRHPRHPVGWLLCAGLFFPALDMFSAGYAAYATYRHAGSLLGVTLALVWLKLANLAPLGLVAFTLIVLLFPDGRFPSPGWRKVVWTTIGTLCLFLLLQAVEPDPVSFGFLLLGANPLAVSPTLWVYLLPLMWAAFSILALCYAAAIVSLIVRLRQSRGDVRQQVKWLLPPVGLYGIFVLLFLIGLAAADDAIVGISIAVGQLAAAGIVIAIAIAIFKYRLYDIDLILNRTLVYGALTASVVGLYVLTVGGAGLVFQANLSLAALLITAVATGMIYRPVRAFLQRGVDRLMFGNAGGPPDRSGPHPSDPVLSDDLQSPVEANERLNRNTPAAPVEAVSGQPHGRWMRLARTGWYLCALIAWGILILSITSQVIQIAGASQANLTAQSPAWLIARLVAQTAASLVSLVLAGVLYLKRPKEGLVLLTSYFLLVNGMVITPLTFLESYWPGAHRLNYAVIQPLLFAPLLVTFLSVFPNGRFTPVWTRWLVAGAILHAPVGTFLLTAGALSMPTSGFILAVLTWFALIFTGIYAQIHRYRRVSNAVERQQTKWFLFGFSAAAVLALLLTAFTIGFNYLSPDVPLSWWAPSINLGWALAFAALPVSLTFAVMRYRLFDIDLIINRALVYGGLTLSVAAIYIVLVTLTVGWLGLVFQAQSNLIMALLATGVVALLFQPLRERLQRGVNRLLYGERDDPIEVLSRLGKRLENALPTDQVLPALVETIAQTLKLPFTGIAIQGQIVAAFGKPPENPVTFPLVFQGESTGELLAVPRSPDEAFTLAEMRLLRNLARQAGAAIQNAKLTADLQWSRQTLVTAREEERHRLRRDLHDGIGPTMAGLTLKLDAAKDLIASSLETGETASLEEAVRLLAELKSQTQETVHDIRRIVHGLRPPSLDVLGLAPALQAQFSQVAAPANLRIQMTTTPQNFPRLSAAIEVAAYRIVLEAVTNVIRHANAQTCKVSLVLENGYLQVEIADDGVGIPKERNFGVGLTSMCERAEELGGRFAQDTSSQGTCIYAEIPVP